MDILHLIDRLEELVGEARKLPVGSPLRIVIEVAALHRASHVVVGKAD